MYSAAPLASTITAATATKARVYPNNGLRIYGERKPLTPGNETAASTLGDHPPRVVPDPDRHAAAEHVRDELGLESPLVERTTVPVPPGAAEHRDPGGIQGGGRFGHE